MNGFTISCEPEIVYSESELVERVKLGADMSNRTEKIRVEWIVLWARSALPGDKLRPWAIPPGGPSGDIIRCIDLTTRQP